MKQVAIIGAGLGGLATACYAAQKGYLVTLYEKNSRPGGRAMLYQEKGYTFDTGPSWYWMPNIFERFFADFGKKVSDYYELIKISPSYRVFFSEYEQYDIPSSITEFLELAEKFEKGSSLKLKKIFDNGRELLELATKKFLYRDYPNITSMLIPELGIEAIKRGSLFSLESLIKKNFSDSKLQKLVTWHSLFLGASPKNLPSLYSFILNVDFEQGTWFPKGGIYKVVEGIVALAQELGVEIECNKEATSIEVDNGIAKRITFSDGSFAEADIIVSNADYHHTETALLKKQYQTISEKQWNKKVFSPSTVLFYLGLDIKLNNSLHHNYYFSLDTWDDHFDSLFGTKRWPDGVPSYYFHATSKTDNSVAPSNGESLFILVPVASGIDDTDEIRESLYERIIAHLSALAKTDIKPHVVVKRIMSPRDHQAMYNAYQGNNFGLAQTLFQTAAFRPYNKSRKIRNLYYVGHYTHPGIGLPLVLISGYVTSQLLLKENE